MKLFTCSSTSSLMAQINSQKCGRLTKSIVIFIKFAYIWRELEMLFIK